MAEIGTLMLQESSPTASGSDLQLSSPPAQRLEERPNRRLISPIDREYLQALASLGYTDEAVRLLDMVYEEARSTVAYNSIKPRLLHNVDLDYIEVLLLIGQRSRALRFIFSAVERFEREAAALAGPARQSRLDSEYRRTIRAIEEHRGLRGGRNRASSRLASLLGKILRKGSA